MQGNGRGRGRGRYYKQKYGRIHDRGLDGYGSAGEKRGAVLSGRGTDETKNASVPPQSAPESFELLHNILNRIDSRPYGAYNDIKGRWTDGAIVLGIDYVQSDPFAPPSRCHVEVPKSIAGFDDTLWTDKTRRIALCDYLTRTFAEAVKKAGADIRLQEAGWSSVKGGDISIDKGGQHVLERTSVLISDEGSVEARFSIALPARGRSILGDLAIAILVNNLPRYVEAGLFSKSLDMHALRAHIQCVEDTEALRNALPDYGLVAFVGNGSILPRASGASDCPLASSAAVPFLSPPSMQLSMELPSGRKVLGMGIPTGITLIVGGGFHGKSTLLKALEVGYTNKVPGDGRELVVTVLKAVKIRAEDGRRIQGVDISSFISNLPFNVDTKMFCTDDASGSTSQAANVMEALEIGADLMLVDEDTTATNFMIRDARMQALVSSEMEPITPLVSKIRDLSNIGVSCILVMGGSGAYFDVSDRVIQMDCFSAKDVTQRAHAIADASQHSLPDAGVFAQPTPRIPRYISNETGRNGQGPMLKVDIRTVHLGHEMIDLTCIEQIVEKSQTRAIGKALCSLMNMINQHQWKDCTLAALLEGLEVSIEQLGLDSLARGARIGDLARPRYLEIAAAFNRLRTVKVEQNCP